MASTNQAPVTVDSLANTIVGTLADVAKFRYIDAPQAQAQVQLAQAQAANHTPAVSQPGAVTGGGLGAVWSNMPTTDKVLLGVAVLLTVGLVTGQFRGGK